MTTQGKPKMKLWLRIVLVGSLALNLLIMGLAVGAAWRFQDGKGMRSGPSMGAMLFRELDPEVRKQLREQAGGGHGSHHKRRQADAKAVLTSLRASPFELDVLAQVLAQQTASRHDFQSSVQQAWLRQIEAMSDTERAEYADRLEQMLHKPRGKGRQGEWRKGRD